MAQTEKEGLEPYRIESAPSSMFYIPNFIDPEEETYLLSKIPSNKWISLSRRRLQAVPARLTASNTLVATAGLPDWLSNPVVERFEHLRIFTNSPHGTVNHCLIVRPLWSFQRQEVLLTGLNRKNEYLPGQGIMPHEDGAAYHPVVATVSLGGSIVLDVTEKVNHDIGESMNGEQSKEHKVWRILQEPRSLLVTTISAYRTTLHGIADVKEDVSLDEKTVANWSLLGDVDRLAANGGRNERTTRISLTYRDVLKVSSIGSRIFGKPRT